MWLNDNVLLHYLRQALCVIQNGEMSFTLQNDGFKMETKWDKLAIPNFSKSR